MDLAGRICRWGNGEMATGGCAMTFTTCAPLQGGGMTDGALLRIAGYLR